MGYICGRQYVFRHMGVTIDRITGLCRMNCLKSSIYNVNVLVSRISSHCLGDPVVGRSVMIDKYQSACIKTQGSCFCYEDIL